MAVVVSQPALTFAGVLSALGLLAARGAAQQEPPTDDVKARLDRLERRLDAELDENEKPESGAGLTSRWGETQLTLQLFGDYGFSFHNPAETGVDQNSFAFGSMGLLVTGRIGDHFRTLSETLIEGDGDNVGLDEERLWGAYDFNDSLYLKLGLEHLPTARWNRMYHHGKWLELTIKRPFLARFEDDGGILPMHESGLELGGQRPLDLGLFEYVAVVSNGRGPSSDDRQRGADENDAKSVDLAFALSPAALRGLTVGANGRWDVFPTDHANPPLRTRGEREFTTGAFATFDRGALVAIGEITFLQHQDRTSGVTFHHHAAYVQAGWRLGEFTPYLRGDTKSMDLGDPFYIADDRDLDAWEATAGVRYELAETAALKVEFRYGRYEERDVPFGPTDAVRRVTLAMQLSWFF